MLEVIEYLFNTQHSNCYTNYGCKLGTNYNYFLLLDFTSIS